MEIKCKVSKKMTDNAFLVTLVPVPDFPGIPSKFTVLAVTEDNGKYGFCSLYNEEQQAILKAMGGLEAGRWYFCELA